VRLANGIAVELTATARAGHHVYRFPSAGGTLVLDLAAALDSEVEDAELTVDAATQTVRGRLRHRGGMTGSYGGYDLYFTARARTPWTAATVWSESAAPGPGPSATGTGVGAAPDLRRRHRRAAGRGVLGRRRRCRSQPGGRAAGLGRRRHLGGGRGRLARAPGRGRDHRRHAPPSAGSSTPACTTRSSCRR
jgi:hypothetical protein